MLIGYFFKKKKKKESLICTEFYNVLDRNLSDKCSNCTNME